MAIIDEGHVLTGDAVIIWEAVTKPDVKDDGGQSWNLRVAMPADAPEITELQALVRHALHNSNKKGVTQANPGNNPISNIDAAKFPELPGYVCFSAGTIQGAPPVFDKNGAELQSMVYGPKLYNGCKVRLLVHSYCYENKQKGVNFGLDGVQIIDSNAPRLSIGAAGMAKDKVASVFGGSAATAAPAATPAPAVSAPPPPPVAVAVAPAPEFLAVFPPEGWTAHPQAPGYYYKGQEVLSEEQLRARG